METRFIGLEGYDRIENVTGKNKRKKRYKKNIGTFKKTVRFTKRLSAEISRDMESRKNKKRHAHSAPARGIKKKALLTAMACITAAILCGVTVSALGTDPAEADASQVQHDAQAQVVSNAPVIVETVNDFNNNTESEHVDNPEVYMSLEYYALAVDGKEIGVTEDGETLQTLLDNFLVEARAGYDDTTTTEFANDVQIINMMAPSSQPETAEEVFAKAKDKLSVSLYTDWSYEVDMEYETNVTYDDTKDNSYEEVTKEGETGKTTVYMRLNYVDGNLTDSVVTDTKITKEPVAEEITKGSKQGETEYKSDSESTATGESTGNFMWPVPHTHNITSYMEWRWGRMHNGLDIAGGDDYGQPIVASDGGVVTFAGNDGGGYGNYVMIDHGNGYMTVYGHASEICCTTGQYVNQGDTIALIGSTGNSTGPHLHFEIRLNGEYQNPLNYVS